ncbi:MAG: hypothetical protein E6X43_06115, partial [Peptostreptococcaceae bacterium]|nr:hypothetical protein [Peptostreptococcaceae bacterium]
MSNNQKLSKLDELLRLDIEMENQYKLNKQNYQVAIFNYIHLSGIDINNSDKLKQTLEDIIKENLDFLNNDDINIKDRALTRLRLLNKIGILGEEEKELFGNILWKSSKQGELPESNLFLKSIYKELPIPKDIDINSIYLNYLKNEDITCSHNLKFRNYTNTCIEIIDNLYKNETTNYLKLTNDDAKELLIKFNKFWQEQKEYLFKNAKYTPFGEDKNCIKDIVDLLSIVIIPNASSNDKISIDIITSIKNDLESNGCNIIYMLPPLLKLNLINENELKEMIKEYIISKDESYAIESIKSIYYWMLINKNDGYINKNIEITDLLVNRLFYSEDY